MVQAVRQQSETRARSPVIDALRRAQANAVVLYLNYKRYHWFTYGPLFRDIHLLFDEHGAEALNAIDPLGERLRILGADPVSTPDELNATVSVAIAEGQPSTRAMIEQAMQNEQQAAADAQHGARLADEAGDYGSVDLFSSVLATHEKHAWFLREILRRDDGLVS